ncbi:hypothetical protein B7463_g2037, partial [Scytalidium lignicola]
MLENMLTTFHRTVLVLLPPLAHGPTQMPCPAHHQLPPLPPPLTPLLHHVHHGQYLQPTTLHHWTPQTASFAGFILQAGMAATSATAVSAPSMRASSLPELPPPPKSTVKWPLTRLTGWLLVAGRWSLVSYGLRPSAKPTALSPNCQPSNSPKNGLLPFSISSEPRL